MPCSLSAERWANERRAGALLSAAGRGLMRTQARPGRAACGLGCNALYKAEARARVRESGAYGVVCPQGRRARLGSRPRDPDSCVLLGWAGCRHWAGAREGSRVRCSPLMKSGSPGVSGWRISFRRTRAMETGTVGALYLPAAGLFPRTLIDVYCILQDGPHAYVPRARTARGSLASPAQSE